MCRGARIRRLGIRGSCRGLEILQEGGEAAAGAQGRAHQAAGHKVLLPRIVTPAGWRRGSDCGDGHRWQIPHCSDIAPARCARRSWTHGTVELATTHLARLMQRMREESEDHWYLP